MRPDVIPFFTIATTSSGLPSIAIRFWKELCVNETNHHPTGVQGTGRADRLRRFVQRACPHVRRDTTTYRGQRLCAPGQRPFLAPSADGVPRASQTLLGTPLLGERLLLHDQRQHHG